MIQSVEEKSIRADEAIVTMNATINSTLNPDVSKHSHEISVLDNECQRLGAALGDIKDSMISENAATKENWNNYKIQLDEKLHSQANATKTSLNVQKG